MTCRRSASRPCTHAHTCTGRLLLWPAACLRACTPPPPLGIHPSSTTIYHLASAHHLLACLRVLQAPAKPQPIFRADYKPPAYLIDTVHLTFNLNEDVTHVTSRLALKPNYAENGVAPPLLLNGRDDVKLVGLKVAGACYHDKVPIMP